VSARRLSIAVAGVLGCLLAVSLSATALATTSVEYQVKAAFLDRFALFVQWEPEGKSPPPEPFRILVFGNDAFDGWLEQYYEKRTIKGRRVEVRHTDDLHGIGRCDLLFIAGRASERLDDILRVVQYRPILTVGDEPGLAQRGVHISFFIKNERVAFEANPTAIRASGLNVSYLLLQVATVVPPAEER
jgi:hypothetical protein